jgi:magnesium transporter
VLEILDQSLEQEAQQILGSLPLAHRLQWESNRQYLPQSVGRFVDPTEAVFSEHLSVAEVVEALEEIITREFVTYAYVVNDARVLVGVLVMRDLLFAERSRRVTEVMVTNPFSLHPEQSLTDAMRSVVTKHFPVYPVTQADGSFIGVVRGFRLFEAQAFEISAQPGRMVGIEKEERLTTSWSRSFRFRHPWLQLNLITAFVAGLVVSLFQETIDRVVILAAFLPILAGQSGNTGCQALAVTLRGITLGDYHEVYFWKILRKEALLGALNGFSVGVIAAGAMYLMAEADSGVSTMQLSVVVLAAMTLSCMVSGISGVLVPLTLKRFGFDPATASSIFLTTATDVASMGLLLGLASLFVLS